ncbi:MAG: nucleotidyltransferase family protein [Aminivibrio sp.]|jgi:predicted nucleotidyltransferase
MIDIKHDHMETVKKILAEYVPECQVKAFGSRVSGKAKPFSDLDLAVDCGKRMNFDQLRLLKEAFENSDLPFRVDVVDWHGISGGFKKTIEAKFVKVVTT